MAHDQRDITLKPSTSSIEPTRTGPEIENRRGEEQSVEVRENATQVGGGQDDDGQKDGGQSGYGNSRTKDGNSDKDMRGDEDGKSSSARTGTSVGLSGDEIAPGGEPEQPLNAFAARSVPEPR